MPAEPFLGQIMIFAGTFAPRAWAACSGQILPINQNQALFSLLGTTFGGNGQTTFALPDLRARVPLHAGLGAGPGLTGRPLGSLLGGESRTLTAAQMPAHTHGAAASGSSGVSPSPTGNLWAATPTTHPAYGPATAGAGDVMEPGAIGPVGGDGPHDNVQPFLGLTHCIALQGVFPGQGTGADIGQYLGEIALFAGGFAPAGWALCDGQTLPINQNQALFSLLGTTFGGNGQTTFALPDLRGRIPVHSGGGAGPGLTPRQLGEAGGSEAVTLGVEHLPGHRHAARCRPTEGRNSSPVSAAWAKAGRGAPGFGPAGPGGTVAMAAGALRPAGGGGAHDNMGPSLVINFIIALQGIYPPRD